MSSRNGEKYHFFTLYKKKEETWFKVANQYMNTQKLAADTIISSEFTMFIKIEKFLL